MVSPASTSSTAPAELVRRILAGESQAESDLVERYSRGVKFLLLELTRDPARADDLHQETFRLVLEKVRGEELREPEKLPAFIRQLARNLFIGEYRKQAKRPVVSGGGAEEIAPPPDPAPSPLSRLLAKENAAIVRRAGEEPLWQSEPLEPDAAGQVTLSVHSSWLEAADYILQLAATDPVAADRATTQFRLRVRRDE